MYQLSCIFAVIILVFSILCSKVNCSSIKTNWIEQKLDHFDKNETRTWKMRYFTNNVFYQPGRAIFIYVNGESSASPYLINYGYHIFDMAGKYKGYLVLAEHRYYGQSKPVNELTNENMKYLDPRQAMSDLAHLIRHLKYSIKGAEYSKIILVGCSYSGTLVTWFKVMYPELAAGVWSSSAPLLIKPDFYESKEEVGRIIKKVGGRQCYRRIKRAINKLESLIDNEREDEVKDILRIYGKFNVSNILDVSSLFYQLSEVVAALRSPPNNDIEVACNKIMQKPKNLEGFTSYIVDSFMGSYPYGYDAFLSPRKNHTYHKDSIRQWLYQTCNGLGSFPTSSSRAHPFGSKFPLEFFYSVCKDSFGSKFTPNYIEAKIRQNYIQFKGIHPDVKNVFWTYGGLDPWRVLGVQDPEVATIIPGGSHCGDIFSINDDLDSQEHKAAKEKIMALVGEWLAEKNYFIEFI